VGGIELRHERVQGHGVGLHVARAGEGPPVVLLHGFPECWYSWRRQIEALARAGFSVLAPDLRGYNLSDKPAGRDAYHLRLLVEDVAALVRTTGQARAHVVGHDWGGILAWTLAGERPELLDKLVILNAPHLRLYFEKVRRPPQLFRSWYVLFFQLPALPERALSAGDFRAVRDMFKRYPAREGAFTGEDIDRYIEALSRPGALTAGLNYYRANLTSDRLEIARSARTEAETLIIWGERDPALGTELLEGIERVAPRVRVHRIPDASHWVQNEAPEEVNRVLVDFLQSCGG
jgi:pimeloyl-ACP methyl ester carboxylesterase